ncbi:MAG TPA: serine protease [Ruminococcaceae bacterium]|nr:serine protease [Oscillospiraceae bacterium]
MKKFVSALMALTLTAVSSVCAFAAQEKLYGDANLDGLLSVKDCTLIQRHCAAAVKLGDAALSRADADRNGTVNIDDATYVQRLLAGYVPQKNYTKEEALAEGDKAVTNLGVELLKAGRKEKKNTLVSPVSVMGVLSMTSNGARGKTKAQMEKVLGMPVNALNTYFKYFQSNTNNSWGLEYTKLNTANSVWCNSLYGNVNYTDSFKEAAEDYYSAEVSALPFDIDAQNRINGWVKENTDNMIDGIVDEINPQSYMYLVNALAFDGKWESPYDPRFMVRSGTFTNADGTKSAAEYLCSEEYKYLSSDSAAGFMKSFEGSNYAFAALLPNEDLSIENYVESLDGKALSKILNSQSEEKVEVRLPKFKVDYKTELSPVLKAMGMTDAFDATKANFTGMIENAPFNAYIGRVIHKTAIEVNEVGTKAAAATSVEIKAGSTPEEPKYIRLDRPFVYMIINSKTNTPLFIGTLDSLN